MMPTIIAFAWGPRYYLDAAQDMLQRCSELGLASRIGVPGKDLTAHFRAKPAGVFTDQQWTCRFIPTFILNQLDELGRDVLYLHADMQIQRPFPDVFDRLDIGLQRRWAYMAGISPLPIYAAPIYARNNQASRRFLRVWQSLCMETQDGLFEHEHLVRTVHAFERDQTCRVGLFPEDIATMAAEADCPIVGHKREALA